MVLLGVGIGVPLAVLVFAALVMVSYRDRRNRKAFSDYQALMPNARGAMFNREPSEYQGHDYEANGSPAGLD